eukprot:5510762-Ditylum_brightwellii.AAC.1
MSTCVVLGGSRHFEIAGFVLGVELKGLTFIGATFDDCEWAGQSVGTVNMLIYNCDRSSLCG